MKHDQHAPHDAEHGGGHHRSQAGMVRAPSRTRTKTDTGLPGPELPELVIPGGAVTITESARALFGIIGPTNTLFFRGGRVVVVADEGGRASIRVLDPAAAQSRLERYVRFVRLARKTGMHEPTTLSEAQARQYLASEEASTLLPKLNGIVQCPLLVPHAGRPHLVNQGYDPVTGFYVQAGPGVERKTLEQAQNTLQRIVEEFEFETPGDRSRALASLLTPGLKLGGWIQGPVPIDVAEANASQAGKTYRQQLVARIYNHDLAVVTRRQGGVGSTEESFQQHLVEGRPFIQFDNLRGKLDSQYLEAFVTADGMVSARVPYQGNINIDPTKHLIFISSNGYEATKDLANRSSIVRIRKREGHQFQFDIVGILKEHPSVALGAVFALIEEWHRQGCPRTRELRHDFRDWAQILDWIVQNLLHEAPLMDDHQEAQCRVANPELAFLRNLAVQVEAQNQLGQQLSASELTEVCQGANLNIPHMTREDQLDENKARMVLGRIFARQFGNADELRAESYVIRKAELLRGPEENYKRVKVYTFDREADDAPPAPANG